MRSIGIITINDPINYGNRLQNYAMQKFLESLGYCVETIPNRKYEDSYYLRKKPKEYIKTMLKKIYPIARMARVIHSCKVKRNDGDDKKQKLWQQRAKAFTRFNSLYIKSNSYVIKGEHVSKKITKKYDFFVVGSDQIWNPNYGFGKHTTYLQFAPKYKRIAIAPSFGIDRIPDKYRELIAMYLKEMQYVSIREESGCEIIKELTGKECDIIMDPTLLVNPLGWSGIASDSNERLPQNYVLTYFLGEVSVERKKYIQSFADKCNLQIVNMNDIEEPEVFVWGPETFLCAIKNCDYFFTDSFHGCVFSILFHKQFTVFQREGEQDNMFGRIETLLGMVGLECCEIKEGDPMPMLISEEKYRYIDKILDNKRKETKVILNRVLSNLEGD